MEKLLREWMLVIGLAFLFIAVEFPLLLLMAVVLVVICKLMAKSTPKPMEKEEQADISTPAEEKSPAEPKGSDAFYFEVNKMEEIYDRSAKFVVPKRPIEKSIE